MQSNLHNSEQVTAAGLLIQATLATFGGVGRSKESITSWMVGSQLRRSKKAMSAHPCFPKLAGNPSAGYTPLAARGAVRLTSRASYQPCFGAVPSRWSCPKGHQIEQGRHAKTSHRPAHLTFA
jgi:hypothetical protein